ncbi:MAG: hypothetical protein J6Y43_08000 [Clostridia bacterium]|nr:hypothetical protein [Clostridia bacterium]
MENRLTKKRLSDFLAYEWIWVIVAILSAIVLFEVIYTGIAVKPNKGQIFKYYYDENVYSGNDKAFLTMTGYGTENSIFSFDVLRVDGEFVEKGDTVLRTRLLANEGDMVFTDIKSEDGKPSRAEIIVTNYKVYSFDGFLAAAKEYLLALLKDGKGEEDLFDFASYDTAKIAALFDSRLKGDVRFRSEEKKNEGRRLEEKRIEKLVSSARFLDGLLKYDDTLSEEEKIFFKIDKDGLSRYALRLDRLKNGVKNVSEYFHLSKQFTAENVVAMVFDFHQVQPDMQFECLSVIKMIIENFSDITV